MPMTYREIVWAANGKRYHEYEVAANLMSLMANCHRDPKRQRRPFVAYDFFHRPGQQRPRTGQALTVDVLHGLKQVFTRKG